MKALKITLIALLLIGVQNVFSQESKAHKKGGACCATKEAPKAEMSHFSMGTMNNVPNVALLNQFGEQEHFYDLIKGKKVALNFIFTSCKTICPPMGANFVSLKKLMKDKVESSELVMLTISIDPITDTPERLLAWSEKFEAGKDWTLLTGSKEDIDGLLKKLEVYTALKEEHAPIILLGDETKGDWVRTNGLADPQELAKTLNGFFKSSTNSAAKAGKKTTATTSNPDENYFTNVELINQHGETMRLYADLMKDKVVIINPFFSECTGICPVMSSNLEQIQKYLGDQMGEKVHIISLTVDHETDNQSILEDYAQKYGAKDGWYFMTGKKENIELALKKLGKYVENREAHDAIFLVGNVSTKLWKKVNGMASINDIIAQIDSVINDSNDQ